VSLTVDSPGYHLQTRRTTTALAGIALCLIVAVAPPSFAADNQSSSASAPQTETLVLRVNLNTENKGDLFVQCASDLDFLLTLEDVRRQGAGAKHHSRAAALARKFLRPARRTPQRDQNWQYQ
jgi:hypothetical protein